MQATIALAILALAASCGGGDAPVAASSTAVAPSVPAPDARASAPTAHASASRTPRVATPELASLRRALDLGDLARARELAPVAATAGREQTLLEARLAALSGSTLDALRAIERARERDPQDPDVYATAAEIYAWKSSFDSAWEEIRRGTERCGGETPELVRAKGVAWVARENGAERALQFLERARALDPELPFVDRAMAQAHLLLGKSAARERKLDRSLEHAREAARLDPDDVDTARFLSEACAASGDFETSTTVLEELARRGEPVEVELASRAKQAGMSALIAHDRDRALRYFALARGHGLGAEELGTGARLLAEAALVEVERGVALYEAGDLGGAEARFHRALELDPDDLQAINHLGVVSFQLKRYDEAVSLWTRVIDIARGEGVALPEPVHLNLARAHMQLGDRAAARAVLEEYVVREPEGQWIQPTRILLAEISGEPAPR